MASTSEPRRDRVQELQRDVDEVKGVMQNNVDKVLTRGEKLDTLQDKSSNMNSNAQKFKKQSTSLKKEMWWKNAKMNLLIGGVLLIIIMFIVFLICGFDFSKC